MLQKSHNLMKAITKRILYVNTAILICAACFIYCSGITKEPAENRELYNVLGIEGIQQKSSGVNTSQEITTKQIEMFDTDNSTCFSKVGYSEALQQLKVVFRNTGNTYVYYEVPHIVYIEMVNSNSMGNYFNKNIKGNYAYEKLN